MDAGSGIGLQAILGAIRAIARKRLAAGVYGQKNLGMRKFVKQGFSPDFKVFKLLRMGVWQWLKCEWHALWLRPQAQEMPLLTKPIPPAQQLATK
jgi:hypothetical protein